MGRRKLSAIFIVVAVIIVLSLLGWRWNDKRAETAVWRHLEAAAPRTHAVFDPAMVADLPEPARRYFLYSIAEGARLSTVVEIDMTGELGLGGKETPNYRPMRASQILAAPYGLVWRVTSGAISGSDSSTVATSWTRFWLFNLIPVVRVGGDADHHRSALGRVAAEGAFWAPASLLPNENIRWELIDDNSARAIVDYGDFEQSIDIVVNSDGQPTQVIIGRWSNVNPDKTYRIQPFGGYLSEFREFDGYRLPTKVEGGNLIGSAAYYPFYKATVSNIRVLGGEGG